MRSRSPAAKTSSPGPTRTGLALRTLILVTTAATIAPVVGCTYSSGERARSGVVTENPPKPPAAALSPPQPDELPPAGSRHVVLSPGPQADPPAEPLPPGTPLPPPDPLPPGDPTPPVAPPAGPANPVGGFLKDSGLGGGGGFMGAAGFLAGPPVPFTSYHATWYPDQPVSGQGTKLGFFREDLLVSAPVWRTTTDQLTVHANVRNEAFSTGAVLPDSGRPFPDALWNVQTGLNYTHRFDNNWIAGGMLNVGSASDKPFHSIDEMTVSGAGFLRVPSGDRNAWLFTLVYSPTSQLAFPVPVVAYFYQPSDRFFMTLGLPLHMVYRPTDDLLLDFSYMLLTNVHAGAVYRLGAVSPRLFLHGAFDWKNESYFLADRTDRLERLFYYDKTLSAGARYNFSPHLALDLTGGYAFDRYYFTGRKLGDSHHDRVDVGAGPYLSLQLQGRW